MRKIFAVLLCFCLLILPVLGAIPAGAAEKPWSTLFYMYDPVEPGADGERGELDGVSATSAEDRWQFLRTITVSCNTEQARLLVNGEQVDSGECRLSLAGDYDVKIQNKETGAAVTYYLQVLPELGFVSGHVFTEFPQLSCANATSIQIQKAGKTYNAAEPLTEFGEYQLKVYGIESQSSFNYTIFVHYCSSERITDAESGKEALKITVGEFPGLALEAMLDGAPLAAGETVITAVGQHTLSATVNGSEADSALMPAASELLLQVSLQLDALEAREPFFFDLSAWDANFYLDGQRVSGVLRVTEDGEHTLTVRDANGQEMQGMILLRTSNETEFRTVDSVTFTFRNPHKTYAIVAAIPAALLLGAALYFLVARRRIV